jgi:hypothetical protein
MNYIHTARIGYYGKNGEDKYGYSKVTSYKKLSYVEMAQAVKKNNPKKIIWFLDLIKIKEVD